MKLSNPFVTSGQPKRDEFAARAEPGGKISRRDLTYGPGNQSSSPFVTGGRSLVAESSARAGLKGVAEKRDLTNDPGNQASNPFVTSEQKFNVAEVARAGLQSVAEKRDLTYGLYRLAFDSRAVILASYCCLILRISSSTNLCTSDFSSSGSCGGVFVPSPTRA